MRWTYDPSALYTVLCIDEGEPNDNDDDVDYDYVDDENKKKR